MVDKPADMSSAQVVARVKRRFGVRKVGHAGTLDPFATGILICCVNRATRLARFFLHGEKTYEAGMRLGVQTDTMDATGSVVSEKPVSPAVAEQIGSVFERFIGEIDQRPPIFSALKHRGEPLYKLARRGEAVLKPERKVRISRLRVLEVFLPRIRFEVSCSGGTYVRALCADIGDALGCGAHLESLRRTETGGFTERDAAPLADLETASESATMTAGREEGDSSLLKERLIPMAEALGFLPRIEVGQTLAEKIRHGRSIAASEFGQALPEGTMKIVDPGGDLVAVVSAGQGSRGVDYLCVFD